MADQSGLASGLAIGGIFFWIVGFALFVFWIIQVIDVIRRDFGPGNTKVIWVLVVILLGWIGALIYVFAGKSQGTLQA